MKKQNKRNQFGINNKNYKHGKCLTKEYNSWKTMIQRCYNKNKEGYERYGGRKIKVCDEWKNSFETFFKDMGYKPFDNYSLDRINNNKGYSKDNCKWSTIKEQCNNRNARGKLKFHGINIKLNKYEVNIYIKNHIYLYLGRYTNLQDAIEIYDLAAFIYNKDRRFRNKLLLKEEKEKTDVEKK